MFFQHISKSRCKFDSGLFQPILGLKMSPVMIWIVLGCCWVSQMRTKPGKNIWGPLLNSITSYYVQRPWENCQLFSGFLAPWLPYTRVFPSIYWLTSDAGRLVWTSTHVTMAKYGSFGCGIRSEVRWRDKYSLQNVIRITSLSLSLSLLIYSWFAVILAHLFSIIIWFGSSHTLCFAFCLGFWLGRKTQIPPLHFKVAELAPKSLLLGTNQLFLSNKTPIGQTPSS